MSLEAQQVPAGTVAGVGVAGAPPGGTAGTTAGTDAPAQANGPALTAHPPVAGSVAFAAGVSKMPRRLIYVAVAAVLVLGLGSSLVDRVLSTSSPAPRSRPTVIPSVRPVPPINGVQLAAPLPAFLGLTSLKHKAAPAFVLSDARTGAPVSLDQLRGRLVVLTFMNAACDDLCPVLASELRQAAAQLGTTAVPVTFVTINTDPLDLQTTTAAVLSQATLAAVPGWRFLTGSIKQLNPVWKDFGIGISADRSTGVASHNDLLYFIRPNGRMAWSATPFANESPSGAFSLSAAEQARFAQGVAQYADKLAGGS